MKLFDRENRLYLAWIVALLATLGSLWFSEVKHYIPCVLCWFQRICMYPLVIILGIAAFDSDLGVRKYILPLTGIGWLIAVTQNLETWGVIKTLKVCGVGQTVAGCDVKWPIWGAGSPLNDIVSIPMLSLIAFTLIIALLSWKRPRI